MVYLIKLSDEARHQILERWSQVPAWLPGFSWLVQRIYHLDFPTPLSIVL